MDPAAPTSSELPLASLVEPLLMLVVLLNFVVLGSSRLRPAIRAVGVQGFTVGLLALVGEPHHTVRNVAVGLAAMALKGLIVPRMLEKAMASQHTERETRPLVGFVASLLLGALGTGAAIWIAGRLPMGQEGRQLYVPAALSCVVSGFWVLTTRRTAVAHVFGFLVIENGVFTFGLLLLGVLPSLVEAGVLLDVFAGVFIMGILLSHIDREIAKAPHDAIGPERDPLPPPDEPLTSLRESGTFRALRSTDPQGAYAPEPHGS
jgi:hydrogenase-4 component E